MREEGRARASVDGSAEGRATPTHRVIDGGRVRKRKDGVGLKRALPRVDEDLVVVCPRLDGCGGGLQSTLQRAGKVRVLLSMRTTGQYTDEEVGRRAERERERTKKRSWLPVNTTLHPRHFLLAAFLPPSVRSSLRLRRPTLVILSVETGGRSFFLGGSTKVPLLTVGASGAPAR